MSNLSHGALAEDTARWVAHRPPAAPGPAMQLLRRATVATATAAALVVLAVPAWAQPSFTSGGTAEAGTQGHQVTMQVPEDDRIGQTTSVAVTAPSGFTVNADGCIAPVGWTCSVSGRTVTWTSGGLAALGTFGFNLGVTTTPGTYTFPVSQADASGASVQFTGGSAPTMTVTGDAPSDEPADDEGGSGEEPASTSGGGSAADEPGPAAEAPAASGGTGGTSGAASTGPATPTTPPAPTTDGSAPSTASTDDGDEPVPTQGRASGSTLAITPGTAPDPAAPAIAPPAEVAPAPTAGPTPVDDDGEDTTTAVAASAAAEEPGMAWQQVLGAALLAVGGGIVGLRRWRQRG